MLFFPVNFSHSEEQRLNALLSCSQITHRETHGCFGRCIEGVLPRLPHRPRTGSSSRRELSLLFIPRTVIDETSPTVFTPSRNYTLKIHHSIIGEHGGCTRYQKRHRLAFPNKSNKNRHQVPGIFLVSQTQGHHAIHLQSYRISHVLVSPLPPPAPKQDTHTHTTRRSITQKYMQCIYVSPHSFSPFFIGTSTSSNGYLPPSTFRCPRLPCPPRRGHPDTPTACRLTSASCASNAPLHSGNGLRDRSRDRSCCCCCCTCHRFCRNGWRAPRRHGVSTRSGAFYKGSWSGSRRAPRHGGPLRGRAARRRCVLSCGRRSRPAG